MSPRDFKDDNQRGIGCFLGRTVKFLGTPQNRSVQDSEHDGSAGRENQPDGRHERKNIGVARRYGFLFNFIYYC